ncbi:TIGR04104 family putative zinc finger protein [Carnobacterium sp.]|uniref:TIGR04104 family putative zinc finger protein n=1 Tax=Carnobacterium sp. TaxID=48221 RepID=UPI0028AF4B10|nr:TIGR04104 family putative zinc finger protein [Carnobacterium sp.]
MPTCQNCKNKWGWKETFKKTFTTDPAMKCPYCGEKQYTSLKTRKWSLLFSMLPLLPLLLNIFLDISLLMMIGLIIGSGILYICLYPFVLELSNQEEPLF